MADGGVKNMLRRFESNPTGETASPAAPTAPAKKPQVASKPKPLAKPESPTTGNEAEQTTISSSSTTTNGIKSRVACMNSALTPKGLSNGKPSNGKPSDNNNNNKSSAWGATTSTPNGEKINSHKDILTPPKITKYGMGSGEPDAKPPTLPKSSNFGSKPTPGPGGKPRVALLPKPELAKTQVSKTDSAASSASDSSLTAAPSNTSASSNSPSEANLFSKNLRPVGTNGLPAKIKLPSLDSGNNSTLHSTSPPPPPLPKSVPPIPISHSASTPTASDEGEKQLSPGTNKPQTLLRYLKPNVNMSDLRNRLKRNKDNIETENALTFERQQDGKKFKKLFFDITNVSSTPPEKPTLPANVDIISLRNEFDTAMNNSKSNEAPEEVIEKIEELDDDELYADGESLADMRPSQPPLSPATATEIKNNRISVIPDISAEEEGYNDEDIYTIAESEQVDVKSSNTECVETEQEKKKRLKEEADARRKEEKERKEREKQEKSRKKKEEEMVRLRKKFQITGDVIVGEGVIKNDTKGNSYNLKVRKGQLVTILRIDNNPPNKWLVKTETQMGYVDSSAISVDPAIIKQAMTQHNKKDSVIEDPDQPTYDAVPEDTSTSGSTTTVEELYEEVYEECGDFS